MVDPILGPRGPSSGLTDGSQIERLSIALQHGLTQSAVLGPAEIGILDHECKRILPRQAEQVVIADQVAETELAQSMLPCTEELPEAAQAGVCLGQRKAIRGPRQEAYALLGLFLSGIGEEVTLSGQRSPAD